MARKSRNQTEIREAKIVKTPDEEFDNEFLSDDAMLLPNDGDIEDDVPQEEEDEELAEDKRLFGGNEALVEAVFEWLDDEIASCDSIEAAHIIAKQYDVSIEAAMTALDVCRKVFSMKRVTFQNIHDTLNKSD